MKGGDLWYWIRISGVGKMLIICYIHKPQEYQGRHSVILFPTEHSVNKLLTHNIIIAEVVTYEFSYMFL